jgi:hypothetical protein
MLGTYPETADGTPSPLAAEVNEKPPAQQSVRVGPGAL